MTNRNGTAGRILAALQSYALTEEKPGQYRANSPLRPGSNSHAFTLTIDDDEKGAYYDHVSGESGSLYNLADALGIERSGKASDSSKGRVYDSLKDYAGERYEAAFVAAGWSDVQQVYDNQERGKRPALVFSNANGKRARFVDGLKPAYKPMPKEDATPCWYGLRRAVQMGGDLVLCNGESSVITAQAHDVPAVCVSGSGEGNIATHLHKHGLLDELRQHYPTGRILIALDCDQAGHKAARAVLPLLASAGYDAQAIDLGGAAGYDMRDFCRLHQDDSPAALARCEPLPPEDQAEDPDAVAIIDITDKNLGRATEQIWAAMQESSYAGALYRYGSEAAYLDDRLYTLDRVRWRGLVNRVASFMETKPTKDGGSKTEEVLPPLAMIQDSLVFLPNWLPVIDRVSPLPVFDQAGHLLANGYHAGPRVLVQSDIAPIPMDAGAALALLDIVFCDFPFATQADKANALAYLFAPFIREMCGPMPLFLLDAAQRGTGKTLLNDLIHTIWTGENAPLSDLPLNAEEQRKAITTHLMHGPASIVFDDISLLQGNAIQRAVTGHTWSDRLLGKNQEINVPIRAIFSATGNNITLAGDMVRRVLLIRLESQEENPSQRTGFKRSENELRAFVREHRAELVSACIALVEHGLAHGTPQAIKMGGFDQFASVMSRVLHGIGAPGFYDNMQQTFEREDSRQTGWKAIVWAWYEAHGTDMVRAGDVAKLIEEDNECEISLEGDTTKARDTAAGKLLKQRVGSVFAFSSTRLQIQKTHNNKGKARYRLKELDVSPEPTTPRGGGGGDIPHQEASAPHSPHSPHRDCHTHVTRARAQEKTQASYVGYVGYVEETHQEAENGTPARNLMARAMEADNPDTTQKPAPPAPDCTDIALWRSEMKGALVRMVYKADPRWVTSLHKNVHCAIEAVKRGEVARIEKEG
jgi:hypothetical protein